MIDARKWIWIPLVCLALGLVIGVSWPGCKCDWTPAVVVEPAPIADEGLRVLLTYDAQAKGELPIGQQNLIASTAFRAYLDGKCAKDPKGIAEWRIVPLGTEFPEEPIWQKLMALNKPFVVSNGKTGFAGDLPSDEAAALAIVQKHEGSK